MNVNFKAPMPDPQPPRSEIAALTDEIKATNRQLRRIAEAIERADRKNNRAAATKSAVRT